MIECKDPVSLLKPNLDLDDLRHGLNAAIASIETGIEFLLKDGNDSALAKKVHAQGLQKLRDLLAWIDDTHLQRSCLRREELGRSS